MCDSKLRFDGCEINRFYGKKQNLLDIRQLRRKQKLAKFEKYVASKRSADAVALNNYSYITNSQRSAGNIVTSHSKVHVVFSKQNDAISFSLNQVRVQRIQFCYYCTFQKFFKI